jgi:serine/threonine protein kinase
MWKSGIRYEIQELLGEGSQGSVYKALRRDRRSGLTHTVAAKILHSKNAVELWRREFESLSRVRSAYCVQVHAFERLEGRPALILEYVEGVSLYQLADAVFLSAPQVAELVAQIECGLLDLHKYGVFHGDLSPHNVLVDKHGRIRLLDFGLANCEGHAIRLTPEFAAPERIAGGRADFASDVFSLGRIEQFLLGKKPSLDTESPYLNVMPAERRLREIAPSLDRQNELGLRVAELIERRERARAVQTRTIGLETSAAPSLTARIVGLITSGLVMAASGASPSTVLGRISPLHIRTEKWVYVSLNGSPLGYSPLSVPLASGKSYKLEWLSAEGRGEKHVKVEAGRELTLTDRDFSH